MTTTHYNHWRNVPGEEGGTAIARFVQLRLVEMIDHRSKIGRRPRARCKLQDLVLKRLEA